jgi:cation:H+ antiporter
LSVYTAALASIFGLVTLTYGADVLVRGASRLAIQLGVTPLLVGLTIVAYGTSAPELVASVVAALAGHPDVAVGNVLGSNVANTGLILGGTALLAPILVARSVLRQELPLMIVATVLFGLFALRLEISRPAGFLFVTLLVLVNYLSIRWARREARDAGEGIETKGGASVRASLALTGIGLVLLLGGAHVLVGGAIALAREVGLSDFVIGVTLVAVGTSLPELATSIVAGLRKEVDLVVGNIVGSNLFNIFGALGFAAIVRPIPIDAKLLRFEFPALAVITVAMVLFLATGRKVSRFEGFLLLAAYVAFVMIAVR